jgi:uncharacterized protein (DUF58 family)
MARLDRLDLLSRKILTGKLRGERVAHGRGASLEFEGFRDYAPGDDPRFIDWNILARLDRLLLKLFTQEEDLQIHLLLDQSKSCDFGQPNKAFYLRQTTAAIAYVALVNHHRLRIWKMSDRTTPCTQILHGRRDIAPALASLQSLQPQGACDFEPCCRHWAAMRPPRGVCVVLSDFLFGDGIARGLAFLRAAGQDLHCIQALSPQELDPSANGLGEGTMRLIDLEFASSRQLNLTPQAISQYQLNLRSLCQRVEQEAKRNHGSYLLVSTATPVEQLVLDSLRRQNLLG